MRYLVVLLLAGCTQTMHLYPRGGGDPVVGTLRTAEQTMKVPLDGEIYEGSYMGGRSTSVGASTAIGARPTTAIGSATAFSNSYSGLLVSQNGKTLRCEFIGAVGEQGNGVCQHGDGRVFDLLLKP